MTSPDTPPWLNPSWIDLMLDDLHTWAIIGLGNNPSRTAYEVAGLLQRRGKKIVPIHPSGATVLGQTGYTSLRAVPFDVDVVDVFRRSEDAGQFVDEALTVGARAVWFQLGVIDHAAFARAEAANLPMVMDTCPTLEWRRRQ